MPDGSPCAAHPEAGVATCPHCGTFVCSQCVTRYPWGAFACAGCAERGRPRFPLSWQQRFTLRGWWQAFTAVLLQPRALFSHFPELSLARAFAFAAIGLGIELAVIVRGDFTALPSVSPVQIMPLFLTPLVAWPICLLIRLATSRADFRTVLASLWLLDGAYHIVAAPVWLLPSASLADQVRWTVAWIVISGSIFLWMYARAMWWLIRRHFATHALVAVSAMVVYAVLQLSAVIGWQALKMVYARSQVLMGPAGIDPAPEP